jgi:putative Mn2+ efflux pump MntP
VIAKTIALVLPLGLDTFAVCCALGIVGIAPGRRDRISMLMVAFEAGMPLIGLALGTPLGHTLGAAADYLAVAVLFGFGAYTLLADEDEQRPVALLDATGWRVAALGVSISLDELAVGFTLGLLKLPVLTVIIAIAAQTMLVTQLGMRFGAKLGEHVRERAEQLAGGGLMVLACVLLAEQLIG